MNADFASRVPANPVLRPSSRGSEVANFQSGPVSAVAVHRTGGVANTLFARCVSQHRHVATRVQALRSAVADATLLMGETLHRKGRLIFFGDSGSGAIAALLAESMQERLSALTGSPRPDGGVIAFAIERSAKRADEADDFASAMASHGRTGDCAVVVSASGDAANVLTALHTAREAGMVTVGLLGNGGGAARHAVDVPVLVAVRDPMRLYEAHLFAGHTLCRQLEWSLRPVPVRGSRSRALTAAR